MNLKEYTSFMSFYLEICSRVGTLFHKVIQNEEARAIGTLTSGV